MQTAIVIEECANPSSDFFVIPACQRSGWTIRRHTFDQLPAPDTLTDSTIILVRYVPPAWANLIARERNKLSDLIYFMDDDILDLQASAGLPWRYRFKLARLGAWRTKWLRQQNARLWVSNPYLAKKYQAWQPQLIPPVPSNPQQEQCRVFYHGSASHSAEINWLRPIIEEVLHRNRHLSFEIVGGQEVYRLYRDMPRVTVIHPMKWPAYQAFLAMPGRHIGLVPQLDLPFNRARSHTKFFDITRSGAVGVYSPGTACSEVVSHGKDGMIVAHEPEAWVEAILYLASNPLLRQTLLHNAEEKLSELTDLAKNNYSDLLKSPPDVKST